MTVLTPSGALPVLLDYDDDGRMWHSSQGSGAAERLPKRKSHTDGTLAPLFDPEQQDPGDDPLAFAWDGAGRLSSITDRDRLGRIVAREEVFSGGTATDYAYGYDLAGRLESVEKAGSEVEHYTYDANGNRLTALYNPGATSRVALPADAQDRISSYGPYSLTYKANGEIATRTSAFESWTLTYDVPVLGGRVREKVRHWCGNLVFPWTRLEPRQHGRRVCQRNGRLRLLDRRVL